MKAYAEFFQKGAVSDVLIGACGDRGTIRLDGRESLTSQMEVAEKTCIERGYLAYQIIKGEHLQAAKPVTAILVVDEAGLNLKPSEFNEGQRVEPSAILKMRQKAQELECASQSAAPRI